MSSQYPDAPARAGGSIRIRTSTSYGLGGHIENNA
jgi:hypothetical protein